MEGVVCSLLLLDVVHNRAPSVPLYAEMDPEYGAMMTSGVSPSSMMPLPLSSVSCAMEGPESIVPAPGTDHLDTRVQLGSARGESHESPGSSEWPG
jgi:hypothetical protein